MSERIAKALAISLTLASPLKSRFRLYCDMVFSWNQASSSLGHICARSRKSPNPLRRQVRSRSITACWVFDIAGIGIRGRSRDIRSWFQGAGSSSCGNGQCRKDGMIA